MKIKLICCVGLDYDTELIPHFCKHYSKYNIYSFHFILNKLKDFEIKDYLEHFSNLPITLPFIGAKLNFEKWVGEFNAIDKIDKFNHIIKHSNESHILLSDIDEFQQHTKSIKSNYVWGNLLDRESSDSPFKKVTSENIEVQFPITSNKSNWKNTIKPCVFPKSELLKTSHFITTPYKNEPLIDVHHYRWTNTRLQKSKDRYRIYTKLNKDGKRWPNGYKLATNESNNIVHQTKEKGLI